MIPDPFGPDDSNGAGVADLEAVGLGPGHAAAAIVGAVEPELLDPPLEVFPGRCADLERAAFALLRLRAEEDVALDAVAAVDGQGLAGGGKRFGRGGHERSIHGWTLVRNSSGIGMARPSRTTTIVERAKATGRPCCSKNCAI